MINAFYQDDIINHLAALFSYGLNNGYSCKAIEERISASKFINELENNKYEVESKIEKVVESTYGISLNNAQAEISFKGLFIAMSYFNLFLYFNKSFEYIFLYWPLSNFLHKYDIYHEMDISNLRSDFIRKINKKTLLNALSRDRHLKLIEISKLTGININTVNRYCRSDKHLYEASYKNIYKLSILFGVKVNIFAEKLFVYLDQSVYLFDGFNKDYRNYLGLYFVSYFDKRFDELDFRYDRINNIFIANNNTKIIVISASMDNIDIAKLNQTIDKNTFVVIFPYGYIYDESQFKSFENIDALDVFVLTQEYIYFVKKKKKKEITNVVNDSLIIRAKEIATTRCDK